MAKQPEGEKGKTLRKTRTTTNSKSKSLNASARSKAKTPKTKSPKKAPVSVDLVQARADFVRFYIEQDFRDATGAYKRAYAEASEATASANSSRLLKDAKVQAAISEELTALLAEKRRPLEKRILDTWMIRAFYDPTEIIDLRGNLKISEAQLRKRGLFVVIDSINKKLNAKGDEYVEYKLADRDEALNMLRQYIQMIEPPKQRVVLENITIGEPPKPAGLVSDPEKSEDSPDA